MTIKDTLKSTASKLLSPPVMKRILTGAQLVAAVVVVVRAIQSFRNRDEE
jgi:hypothetical protein